MSELARRYARALFESGDGPVEEALFQDLCQGIIDCEPLWALFRNPVIHPEQKKAVLAALPTLSEKPRLLRFFCLLAEKQRLSLLPDVMGAYHGLMLGLNNVAHCALTSARPLEEAQLERLRVFLCQKHKKNDVSFDVQLDPDLLGGFTLEIEGLVYDQSIRGRLQMLERQLKEVPSL